MRNINNNNDAVPVPANHSPTPSLSAFVPAADAPAPLASRLDAELTRSVLGGLPVALIAVVICATALTLLLWDSRPPGHLLIGWYGAMMAMVAIRGIGFARYRLGGIGTESVSRWRRSALLGTVVSGLLWGGVPLLLWPDNAPSLQAALIVVLAGICAGGALTLAPLLPAAMTFLWLALPPLVLRLSLQPDTVSLYLAVLSGVYLLSMTAVTRRVHALVKAAFTTQHEREVAEAQAKRQAMLDTLTGLANRHMLFERLRDECVPARRHDRRLAVHFLDLDNFKSVNDSLGHQAGDELLREVARRLRGLVHGSGVIARHGGDEFVIVQTDKASGQPLTSYDVEHLAESIRQSVAEPYQLLGHELHLRGSVGVAVYPEDGDSAEALLQHADAAMYQAKGDGRDNVCFYRQDMQAAAQRRLELVTALRAAIRADGLSVHYQPQVDAAGRIVGLEALVRWQHALFGAVSPAEFVPVAEEAGFIFELHDWIQNKVCADIRRLQDTLGETDCPVVSLNLSPLEFRRAGLLERLGDALRRSGASASLLCLEITEGAAMDDVEHVIPRMEALRALGVSFAIDDFGTGYSSLAYLKRLPADVLKIDRTFVLGVLFDPNDAVLVETIVDMAHNLGLETVAEGVEDQETLEFLVKHGCDYFQGWYFGRAEPLETILPLLQGRRPLPVAAAKLA